MGRALVGSIAAIVAAAALGVYRASGWIYERAERFAADLEAVLHDY